MAGSTLIILLLDDLISLAQLPGLLRRMRMLIGCWGAVIMANTCEMMADQAAALRAQILEIIIILLIAVELFLGLWR